MKSQIFAGFLISLGLGFAVGYLLPNATSSIGSIEGSPVINQFEFNDFVLPLGGYEWRVVEDATEPLYPPLSRSPRKARRIIAQTVIAEGDVSKLVSQFQDLAEQWLTQRGASLKGQKNADWAEVEEIAGQSRQHGIYFPRRYYQIDNLHGVADFWLIQDSERVTVFIGIVEGI